MVLDGEHGPGAVGHALDRPIVQVHVSESEIRGSRDLVPVPAHQDVADLVGGASGHLDRSDHFFSAFELIRHVGKSGGNESRDGLDRFFLRLRSEAFDVGSESGDGAILLAPSGQVESHPALNREKCLYRGQWDESWPLNPRLKRVLNDEFGPDGPTIVRDAILLKLQHESLRMFYKEPSREVEELYAEEVARYSKDFNLFVGLGILQHLMAPTRLLDWTQSPYIAAYFACKKEKEEGENSSNSGKERADGAVWSFDDEKLWCYISGNRVLREVDDTKIQQVCCARRLHSFGRERPIERTLPAYVALCRAHVAQGVVHVVGQDAP